MAIMAAATYQHKSVNGVRPHGNPGSDPLKPLISIVIANYNFGTYLERAIKSVFVQGVDASVELIICDAASTDDSVEIIKKYSDKLAWWCSEKDQGQSDAFNKGFSHARGKYLTWLNADDILMPGCLRKVIESMRKHPAADWFSGNFFRFTPNGKVIEIGWGTNCYPAFLQRKSAPVAVFGPTSFFSKRVYERLGKIDESLHLAMDVDLWQRFMLAGIKQRRVRALCWGFRMHEASKTSEYEGHSMDPGLKLRLAEEAEYIAHKNGYRYSRFVHLLTYLWRVIDCSFLVRAYLKLTFRNFEEEKWIS